MWYVNVILPTTGDVLYTADFGNEGDARAFAARFPLTATTPYRSNR